MSQTTYDVRIHAIEKRRNAKGKVTSHRVLWDVDGKRFRETFKLDAQADSFRSSLLVAARSGEAFSTLTGPTSLLGAHRERHELVRLRVRVRRHEMEGRIRRIPP
ncbi:hypothetical protein [Flindersiella endophytica]